MPDRQVITFEMASNPEETDNLVNGIGSSVVSIGQTNGSSAQDLENGGKTNEDVTVDHMSSYADLKNYAKGFVDVALLVKNGAELHQVSKRMGEDKGSQYVMDVSVIIMISISIILQIVAGILLIVDHRIVIKNQKDLAKVRKLTTAIIAMVFLIIVLNIIIIPLNQQ